MTMLSVLKLLSLTNTRSIIILQLKSLTEATAYITTNSVTTDLIASS